MNNDPTPPKQDKQAHDRAAIQQALLRSIETYFASRRAQVNGFVDQHFSLGGTLAIHRKTLGFDLVRHVLNAYFAVPCIAVKKAVAWLETLGMDRLAHVLNLLPSGLRTDYQKEVERLVVRDLLQLPLAKVRDGQESNALLEELKKDPAVASWLENGGSSELQELFGPRMLQSQLMPDLLAYSSRRSGITEMAGSAVTLLAAYKWFHNTSLGAFEMGRRLARDHAHKNAVSHFFLGKKVGSVFYQAFPVAPSKNEIMIATVIVVVALSALTLMTVILSDPVQHRMGIHRRQILKLLDSLESKMVLLTHRQFGKSPLISHPGYFSDRSKPVD
ncbi:MAG: DUF6635 family protein [Bdellovibrionia bacterium]